MDRCRWDGRGLRSCCPSPFGDMLGDFTRLIAWQRAHAFSLAVHSAFAGRAANAAPGLRNQILRAVSSIPDNLAEGCAKRSRRELAHYADTSYASAKEVMNDLIKSRDLGIIPHKLFDELARQCDDVCRLCFALSRLPPGG